MHNAFWVQLSLTKQRIKGSRHKWKIIAGVEEAAQIASSCHVDLPSVSLKLPQENESKAVVKLGIGPF